VPGLDGGGAAGIVAHGPAQLLDARRERVVADRHAAPNAGEQLLFGDDLRRVHGQHVQHGGSARRQLDLGSIAPKLAGAPIEAERAERVSPLRGHVPNASEFPGILPELRQDFPNRRRQICRMR
jgi:hypothetical protein